MNNLVLKPWQLSFLIHFSFAMVFIIVTKINFSKEYIDVPIEVSLPAEVQNLAEIKDKPKVVLKSVNEVKPTNQNAREVFGASRNSYTDQSINENAVEAKKGNTLTKEVDREILKDSDADSLPVPTEEYLVSQMPVVMTEVKPIYPKEAREKQIQGDVLLDILIDDVGNVRSAVFVEGPAIFKEVAITAMKKFKFRPAAVDGKTVAVKIRYRLKFELEF